MNVISECDSKNTKLQLEDCWNIVYNYLGHSSFTLEKFSLKLIEQRGGNLGDYYNINIHVKTNSILKEINLFAKCLPSLNEATNALVKNGPSQKEDFFYSLLVKEFRSVGLGAYLDFYPQCFLSKVNHILILEDLTCANYQLAKPHTFYTYEMLRITIRQLAKLHAASMVYEEQKTTELGEEVRMDKCFGVYLKEVLFQTEEENDVKKLFDVGISAVTDYLIFRFPDVIKDMTLDEFARKSKEAYEHFLFQIKKSGRFRNTICHGDLWSTNILFRFDNDGRPTDCKMVDFQLTRYCPPAQDLLSHIYLTTNKDTRSRYLEDLIEEYYNSLSKIINSYNLDMEIILSQEEFRQSCDFMKSQAICQALLYAPINLVNDREDIFTNSEMFNQIMMTSREEFIDKMMKKYTFYGETLKELVEDLYEVCADNKHTFIV